MRLCEIGAVTLIASSLLATPSAFASVSLTPVSGPAGQLVQFSVSGATETVRWAVVEQPCPESYWYLYQNGKPLTRFYAQGELSPPYAGYFNAPDEKGVYHLCLSEGGDGSFTVTESEEEVNTRSDKEDELAYEREQAARRTEAQKRPITKLIVRPVSHYGQSSRYPGYTNLEVTTAPWAYVTVTLIRYGHLTRHFEWGENANATAMVVHWTCGRPGGTYRYIVTSHSDAGGILVRRGRFQPVSAARCAALERQEAEARARNRQEVEQQVRESQRQERERLERFETNCRKELGTPITLETSEGPARYCRGPFGGLIPFVPS